MPRIANSIMSLAAGWAALCWAQQSPAFDVASIKPSPPGKQGGRYRFLPGGRFSASNIPLDFLIQEVYRVRPFQVVGEKQWMAVIADGYAARYDIEAKGSEDATEAVTREMLKTLLAERFGLVTHTEERNLPVYSLVVGKSGLKMAPARDDKGKPGRGGIAFMLNGWIEGSNVSMSSLALTLTELVDRPVIDDTGVTSAFDFKLTFTPALAGAPAGDDISAGGCPAAFAEFRIQKKLPAANDSCPSIFTAVQEQLGLKLSPERAPIPVLVIDHVARPEPN